MGRLLVGVGVVLASASCGQSSPPLASRSAAPPPSLRATGSPVPISSQLDVSASIPVILYHDPANFDQIDGMTWDGTVTGRVGAAAANGGIPNSAGTLYATGSDIHDRTGAVVAHVAAPYGFAGRWADDQTHYCTVDSFSANPPLGGEAGVLRVGALNEKPRDVTRIGTFYARTLNGGGPAVAACSIRSDRAILSQSGGQGTGTRQYWAVQLSTGRVLWAHTPSSSSIGDVEVVASPDGLYVAENQGDPSRSLSTVYGPTGAAIARLSGWVSAFSADRSLAVVGACWACPVSLIRLSDQTVLWKGPAGIGYEYWEGVAEPGGTRIALGLRDPAFPQTTGFAPVDLYVVSADGRLMLERSNLYLFTP